MEGANFCRCSVFIKIFELHGWWVLEKVVSTLLQDWHPYVYFVQTAKDIARVAFCYFDVVCQDHKERNHSHFCFQRNVC